MPSRHNPGMTSNDDSRAAGGLDRTGHFLRQQQLPAEYRSDIARHYSRVAAWLRNRCSGQSAFLLGINGAQGSGKTTLAKYLAFALSEHGIRAAVLSLDDFYLTRKARTELAGMVHPMLATRGVPGTHDLEELRRCLDALQRLRQDEIVRWPAFDKARDDRAAQPREYVGPVHAVLFEGWCVATPAEPPENLAEPCNELEASEDSDGRWRRYVNARLGSDYAQVFSQLHGLCYLQVPDFGAVRRWRGEQERKLRVRHGGGLSASELDRFVQHFERLTAAAANSLPDIADCLLSFDADHRCVRSVIRAGHDTDGGADNRTARLPHT